MKLLTPLRLSWNLRPWNDKYLDYEIETVRFVGWRATDRSLETTSTSITRLKQIHKVAEVDTDSSHLKRQVPRLRDWNKRCKFTHDEARRAWNDKYLDYEIETVRFVGWRATDRSLETTSTSITRLKQIHKVAEVDTDSSHLKRQVPRLRDWNKLSSQHSDILSTPWNDKYLDYEIETCLRLRGYQFAISWNDKYLDYEIETNVVNSHTMKPAELETTSTSITRLKLNLIHHLINISRNLKRQVPRLRDWNDFMARRKAEWLGLKRQVPRLRDWNVDNRHDC